MKTARLLLAIVVAVAATLGLFDGTFRIGSGPGGEPPAALANEEGAGGGPEPSGPGPGDKPEVERLKAKLKEVEAEIAWRKPALADVDFYHGLIEQRVAKLRKENAPNLKWAEDQLESSKRGRDKLAAELEELEGTRTSLINAINASRIP